ncbi:MAG: TCP-1/cpn60 chaperonin family protein [Candidatus Helarchaeota archaeon]
MKSNIRNILTKNTERDVFSSTLHILKEDRTIKINLAILYLFAKTLIPMLGPKGSYKLLITVSDNIKITNKGIEVLKILKRNTPMNELLVDLGQNQDLIYGDGVKLIIILTHLLVEKAIELKKLGVHPQKICHGYAIATNKALKIIDSLSINLNNENRIFLVNTLLNQSYSNQFKNFIINSIEKISNSRKGYNQEFDLSEILFIKSVGKRIEDSSLFKGIILKKERYHKKIPNKISNARILVIKNALLFFAKDNTKIFKTFQINTINHFSEVLNIKEKFYLKIVEKLENYNIRAIFCQKRIDPDFLDILYNNGILGIELVMKDSISNILKLSGSELIGSLNDFSNKDIGIIDNLEFYKLDNSSEYLYLSRNNSRIFTFVLRGATVQILDELEKNLVSIIKVLNKTTRILAGGGAIELEIAKELRKFALTFKDKEQYAILNFAKAYENIPAFIIRNSGNSPFDMTLKLKKAHMDNQKYLGYNCDTSKLENMMELGIVDSYEVKQQIIKASSATAQQIIRIDGSIVVNRKKFKEAEKIREKEISKKRNKEIRQFFDKEKDLFEL